LLGVGRSQEAAFTLRAAIPAGQWHLVGDGYLIRGQMGVRFDVIWRAAARADTVLATATHTFAELPVGPTQNDAVAFETDLTGIAAAARPGDLLVLRFTVITGDLTGNYTPNGDGPLARGRYPNLTLP
jgi:hypothetical protein